ncbi:MAG: GTPase-associated system all-helical protein GASH [Candidatus Dadabacteria bacterium]|nr:GTPase-associated system all-helical protein GASH [Candidatus Dadabacteria bacterium]MDE0477839.1 GTPase-associated system all-helical protein GASH [Candidatus Dadabacteria bacterium]
MSELNRLLDRFLEKGLLDLKGNDEWYGHITSTAMSLSNYLRANPEKIVPFTYAALLPDVGDKNPAIEKTLDLLKAEWRTYASVSMSSPKNMLRVIILDALLANAESDDATKSALALLLASALPHLSFGKEEEIWKTALDELLSAVERSAEVAWTVPSQISVPDFPKINVPTIRIPVKSGEVDKEALEKGMCAAAGPTDAEGQPTDGNQHWPNYEQSWSSEFASYAASAISEAISKAMGPKTVSVKPEALAKVLTNAIVNHLESFTDQLASTTHGVEMRSRLLWWKEALVSPSAHISYREIDHKAVPGLMAYDYQAVLPSLAPSSVSAFLVETVRTLLPDDEAAPLVEWLQALATLPHAEALRSTVREVVFADGYCPLVSLVALDKPGAKSIKKRTVFTPDLSLTASQFGLLIFLELQAMKATKEVVSFKAEETSEIADGGADKEDNA